MARRAVRTVARAADHLLPTPTGVRVLIYHRVGGGSDSPVDLPVDTFRRQLELLREHHRVLALPAAVQALAAGQRPDGVVLTFDDGAADFGDVVVPLLAEYGIPATLYLVTSAPERGALPWGVPAVTWAALRDAMATGLVTVGSHTHDHRLLHTTSAGEAAEQLDRSVELIGHHLGVAPEHFAYPKAVAGNRAARAAVAARFGSAALAGHRVNTSARHLQRLGRVPVSRGDDLATFRRRTDGGLRVEGLARDLYGRVRYRGVTT